MNEIEKGAVKVVNSLFDSGLHTRVHKLISVAAEDPAGGVSKMLRDEVRLMCVGIASVLCAPEDIYRVADHVVTHWAVDG